MKAMKLELDVESAHSAEVEAMLIDPSPRSLTSMTPKKRLPNKQPVPGDFGRLTSACDQAHLPHRTDREKDGKTKELIFDSIRRNSICRMLEDTELDAIVDTMECFQFKAGTPIFQQGEVSNRFFVAMAGVMEVHVDGKEVNKMQRGDAFGAIGLLYGCPRTATVTAKEDTVVWGAEGDVFRQVLREHGDKSYAENQAFMDRVKLFDGLSAKQKERIGKLALVTATYDAGARIADEGCEATAIYFVKAGELNVIKGANLDGTGCLSGGTKTSTLGVGDCFGESAVLPGGRFEASLQARSDCRVVCLSVAGLKQILGEDLATCLRRMYIVSILQKSSVLAHLSLSHRHTLAETMRTKNVEPDEPVEDGLCFIVVIDGDILGKQRGSSVKLSRGEWYEDLSSDAAKEKADGKRLVDVRAGPDGATLAILTRADLADALKSMGMSAIGGADHAIDYMRKMLLAKSVPVLRELSQDKVDAFVHSFVVNKYTKGAEVIRQGDVGCAFYIVASGELSIFIDGNCIVKSIGKASALGYFEILFDEPRFATAKVVSDEAELWSIDRQTFLQLVTGRLRQKMIQQIRLQDKKMNMKSLQHVRIIGVGSFGSVRLVKHVRTGLQYALKRIRKEGGEVQPVVKRECELLEEIDYPFILNLVKTFETANSIYILTELVTGGSLFHYMHKIGTFSQKQAQFYIGALALTLEMLHDRNIIYRDLKPENIMLDQHGFVKLIDFGLAKRLGSSSDSASGNRTFTVAGTIYYIAPEVLRGHGYGTEADIWSLGVLLYELVCGRLPFGEESAEQFEIATAVLEGKFVFPKLYRDTEGKALIIAMLCKIPEKRIGACIQGWEDIKSAKYFRVGVEGNLFSQILGHEIKPPVVPEHEQYENDGSITTDSACNLSDDEELGGDIEYLVDNSLLNASTAGLVLRCSKRIEDRDTHRDTQQPLWGSIVVGRKDGKGNVGEASSWLRVGKRFLPMTVSGMPVLTPRIFFVDNSELKAPTAGLIYRCSKKIEDRDGSPATKHPPWGSRVSGIMDDSSEWLQVGDRYLPVAVSGFQVLTPITVTAASATGSEIYENQEDQSSWLSPCSPGVSVESEKHDRLRNTFMKWDQDGNGRITKEELTHILAKKGVLGPEINTVFAAMDKNGDGSIDYQELEAWLYNM